MWIQRRRHQWPHRLGSRSESWLRGHIDAGHGAGGGVMRDDIVVSLEDPVIALVRINRPKVRNALSAALIGEFADMIDSFGNDPEIRAVIVTGTGGKSFSAGADIGEF